MKARRYLHGSTIKVTALGDGGRLFAGSFEVIQLRVECEHQRSGCSFRIIALEGDGAGVQITEEQHDALKRHVLKHAPEPDIRSDWRNTSTASGGPTRDDIVKLWNEIRGDVFRDMFTYGKPSTPGGDKHVEPPKRPEYRTTVECATEGEWKGWAAKRGGVQQDMRGYQREAYDAFRGLTRKTPATSHEDAIARARSLYFGGKPR